MLFRSKKLKEEHPDAESADLWKQAVKEVGPKVIKEAWHTLVPSDSWQDYYEENKNFLAAEVNFWSPFGGVSLSEDTARNVVAVSSRPGSRRRRLRS